MQYTFSYYESAVVVAELGGSMKAIEITHKELNVESLLRFAREIPGAWTGIRISAILLALEGWHSTQIAELFGLSRWGVIQWLKRANEEGLSGLQDRPKPGRPPRLDKTIQKKLKEAIKRPPSTFGIKRARWDGIVVVEYLHRHCGVQIKVRQAQNWMRKLGFVLRQPIYRYVQAKNAEVKKFHSSFKKNSVQ